MSDINKLVLGGNLGDKPKTGETKNGTTYANASVAVSRSYQQDGDWEENTMWVDVSAFGGRAEQLKNYDKGDYLIFSGRLEAPNSWSSGSSIKTNNAMTVRSIFTTPQNSQGDKDVDEIIDEGAKKAGIEDDPEEKGIVPEEDPEDIGEEVEVADI